MTGTRPFPSTLVVGLDGSDTSLAALAYARAAAGDGGRVVAVRSVRPTDGVLGSGPVEPGSGIDEVVTNLPPARAIVETAAERQADGIIIGARRYGLVRGGLGKVAQAVLASAAQPVTLIPPGFHCC